MRAGATVGRRREAVLVRSREQLLQHYAVETELADRLRATPASARAQAYHDVYEELFRLVPHHPQLRRKDDPTVSLRRARRRLRLLSRFVDSTTVFLEVGSGDCALAFAVARRARRVYAVDVSPTITATSGAPPNVALLRIDGTTLPVPAASVDVVYSDQLVEHLHPDDTVPHLAAAAACLKPGGVYVCVTPSRLSGPHDVSGHFGDTPKGLHLREYSLGDLVPLLHQVGFTTVRAFAGGRGRYVAVPVALVRLTERAVEGLPVRARRRVARMPPVRALLGVVVAARR